MTKMIQLRFSLHFLVAFLSAGAFLGVGQQIPAQTEKTQPMPSGPVKPTATAGTVGFAPIYKPPLRGAPSGRVGGGTRGGSSGPDRSVVLSVLTPTDAGWTTQE